MLLASIAIASAQQTRGGADEKPTVVQAVLTEPGSPPFHLKATITEKGDPASKTYVEIFWVAPDKWRRNIQSEDFSQTMIVNGDSVFEQNSDDYFPVGLQTLVTAMVDPRPALNALRPGDVLLTKANGASSESGEVCYPGGAHSCRRSPYGLYEIVSSSGHSVEFTAYQDFKGRRVARLLFHSLGPGNSLMAKVTELKKLKNPDEKLFAIAQPTAKEQQLRSVVLPEAEFRSMALETHDIVWPQVLDGKTTGTVSFYVSVDRSGQVREAVPVRTDNERADESAARQIMKWKFKPFMKDGIRVQAESLMSFAMDTRAWGPPSPLSDAEVRKLVSNIVEPVIPAGIAPTGTAYTLRAAIDYEGRLIEVIPAGGPPKLFRPCYQAISKWHFSPIFQDGEPRPYRAEITCRVP